MMIKIKLTNKNNCFSYSTLCLHALRTNNDARQFSTLASFQFPNSARSAPSAKLGVTITYNPESSIRHDYFNYLMIFLSPEFLGVGFTTAKFNEIFHKMLTPPFCVRVLFDGEFVEIFPLSSSKYTDNLVAHISRFLYI